MCGRFTLDVDQEELNQVLQTRYDIEEFNDFQVPRYNVAPGQNIISVLHDGKKYRVGLLKWGFVPFWAKDEKIGYKMINAKSETLASKPSFKHSLSHKRCVILADGFYEWKKDNNEKIPMRIHLKDHRIFPLAGLWSTYTKEDGSKLYTATIITTKPNDLIESIHDRMPVILDEQSEKIWLDNSIKDPLLLTDLLNPFDPNQMAAYEVSSLVNNAKNEDPRCIKPVL